MDILEFNNTSLDSFSTEIIHREVDIPCIGFKGYVYTTTIDPKSKELFTVQLGARQDSVQRTLMLFNHFRSPTVTLEELVSTEIELFGQDALNSYTFPQIILVKRTSKSGKIVESMILREGNHRVAAARLYGKKVEAQVTEIVGDVGNMRDVRHLSRLQERGDFPIITYLKGFNAVTQEFQAYSGTFLNEL